MNRQCFLMLIFLVFTLWWWYAVRLSLSCSFEAISTGKAILLAKGQLLECIIMDSQVSSRQAKGVPRVADRI